MNVLAIDTASPNPAVSLSRGGELFEEALPSDRRSSEELVPALRRILTAARLRLEDCDRLAVCSGPGSFTGIRVGLATAWGLARASGIPVEAVSTLEAMAEAARPSGARRLAAVLDAGRGEAVLERFDLTEPRARSLAPAVRVPRREIRSVAGGLPIVALPAELIDAPRVELAMRVASGLVLAVARAPRETVASAVVASYSRPSAAEEKRGAS
jgi:tRNA threonylcarbamoyl adenosine modification protein YeaZ